ncbi:MAG TPA: hypothetical protein VEU30_14645, partial [Thermoanaerobaculia bacterium]|nr:hypothetical protein [Thermoanaerobaculia bacterium]
MQASGLPPVVHPPERPAGGLHYTRNLFAYREASAPRPVVHVTPTPEPAFIEPPRPAAVTVTVNAPPAFDYRFIGTFGPTNDRIAAFSRNGEIVTARPGDRIGETFVLQSIGLETVEVISASGSQ